MKEREVSGAQKQEEGPVGTKPSTVRVQPPLPSLSALGSERTQRDLWDPEKQTTAAGGGTGAVWRAGHCEQWDVCTGTV